jgi:hypothetical protein
LLILVTLACSNCATLKDAGQDILDSASGEDDQLDEATVVAGLKEALRVGTERTVVSTSQVDGYLANELIRIAIPEQIEPMTSTLRKAGLGSLVDEVEVGMNRAAELAAAEARQVFWDAITSMTIADAFAILNGGDTAATDYFQGKTWQILESRYQPIVQQQMDEVGLSRLYGEVVDLYDALPLTDKPAMFDLEGYVTAEALTGLFTVLAQEEQKIRQDPLARTTELLRRVFGS